MPPEGSIVTMIRERLPEGIREQASISLTPNRTAGHELRVSWTRPDGQQWSAVEVLSDQQLRAQSAVRDSTIVLIHAVDRLIGEVNRLNRVAIDSLAERYGVSHWVAEPQPNRPIPLPPIKVDPTHKAKPRSAWDRLLGDDDLV